MGTTFMINMLQFDPDLKESKRYFINSSNKLSSI